MSSLEMVAVEKHGVLDVVRVFGVLCLVFLQELEDDGLDEFFWVVGCCREVEIEVHWLLVGAGGDPSHLD